MGSSFMPEAERDQVCSARLLGDEHEHVFQHGKAKSQELIAKS